MEAVALYDHKAETLEELSFSKGQILKVLRLDLDENWYKAEIRGKEGFIPKNYVSLQPNRWFHGPFTVHAAIKQLIKQPPGAFLIRHSNSFPNDFALTVVDFDKHNQNLRIERTSLSTYKVWQIEFSSINKLITYYKRHAIIRTSRYSLKLREFNEGGAAAPEYSSIVQNHPAGSNEYLSLLDGKNQNTDTEDSTLNSPPLDPSYQQQLPLPMKLEKKDNHCPKCHLPRSASNLCDENHRVRKDSEASGPYATLE